MYKSGRNRSATTVPIVGWIDVVEALSYRMWKLCALREQLSDVAHHRVRGPFRNQRRRVAGECFDELVAVLIEEPVEPIVERFGLVPRFIRTGSEGFEKRYQRRALGRRQIDP